MKGYELITKREFHRNDDVYVLIALSARADGSEFMVDIRFHDEIEDQKEFAMCRGFELLDMAAEFYWITRNFIKVWAEGHNHAAYVLYRLTAAFLYGDTTEFYKD